MSKGGGNRKEETNKDKNEKYFDFSIPPSSGNMRVQLKCFWREREDEMSSFARMKDNSIIDERAHAFKSERLKVNMSEKER